jgi:group I intron endonuclease
MRYGGIYKITNVINKKCYVGSAVDIKRRLKRHLLDLQRNNHQNPKLQNEWIKYGEVNFQFEEIEKCERSLLIEKEQYYFNKLNPEYNIYPTAGSPLNYFVTDETKKKIATSHRGLKHSEETKIKISKAHKGKSFSKEHAKKIALAAKKRYENKKNHPMYGKKHSTASKKKMSESLKKLYKRGDLDGND